MPAGDEGAAEETDEQLLSDEDADAGRRPVGEQLAALRDRNRKLRTRFEKTRTVAEKLKAANIENVDDLLRDRETLRAIDQMLTAGEHDRLVAFLGIKPGGAKAPAGETRPDTAAATPAGLIDLKKLPFDPNASESNRWLAGVAERFNALLTEVQQLRQSTGTIDQRLSADAKRGRATAWKAKMDDAAAKIPDEGVRTLFVDNLIRAYAEQEAAIKAGRKPQSIEFFVNHYLTKLKVSTDVRKQVNDAVRQRGAESVARQGKPVVRAGGASGPLNGNKPRTFAEARQHLSSL